jgi:CPA2 family monovalent cation:H+ antiporter-2
MDLPTVLQDLGLILGAGLTGALLVRLLKLPVLVGYILGGVVIGALTGGRLAEDATLSALANFGVAMLMFSIGVELSFKGFWKNIRLIILASLVQTALVASIISFVAVFLGVGWVTSVFLGAALSLSSTALVIKLLEGSGRLGSIVGEVSITWMLIQDLLIVPFFFLLPLIAGQTGQVTVLSITELIVKTGVVLLMVSLVGRKIGKLFMSGLARTDNLEVVLLGIIVWVLGLAAVSVALGLTMSLGVFLAGVMLGESSQETAILSLTRPIRDLFVAIFFTSLGFFLSLPLAIELTGPIVIAALGTLILKFIVSLAILLFLGYHLRLSVEVAGPISGVGEFAFLVMGLGRQLGVIGEGIFTLMIGITLVSIVTTPAFSWMLERGFSFVFGRRKVFMRFGDFEETNEVVRGHIVLCGFGRVGSWVGEALSKEKISYVVVDYHHHALLAAKAIGAPVIYGDSTLPDVLDRAYARTAKAVIVTLPTKDSQELVLRYIREVNPDAMVIARALKEADRKELSLLGAKVVIQPEFEASLSIVHRILQHFGRTKEEVARDIRCLKKEFGES